MVGSVRVQACYKCGLPVFESSCLGHCATPIPLLFPDRLLSYFNFKDTSVFFLVCILSFITFLNKQFSFYFVSVLFYFLHDKILDNFTLSRLI